MKAVLPTGWFAVLLIAALGAPIAKADLTTYTINFTANLGPAPTSGVFTYDPDVSTFSNFLVSWEGIDFDLTSGANAPFFDINGAPPCIGTLTGGAAAFALLSGACSPPPAGFETLWGANTSQSSFRFVSSDNGGTGIAFGDAAAPASPAIRALGNWTITPQVSEVPEPSALVLLGTVCGALALRRLAREPRRR